MPHPKIAQLPVSLLSFVYSKHKRPKQRMELRWRRGVNYMSPMLRSHLHVKSTVPRKSHVRQFSRNWVGRDYLVAVTGSMRGCYGMCVVVTGCTWLLRVCVPIVFRENRLAWLLRDKVYVKVWPWRRREGKLPMKNPPNSAHRSSVIPHQIPARLMMPACAKVMSRRNIRHNSNGLSRGGLFCSRDSSAFSPR